VDVFGGADVRIFRGSALPCSASSRASKTRFLPAQGRGGQQFDPARAVSSWVRTTSISWTWFQLPVRLEVQQRGESRFNAAATSKQKGPLPLGAYHRNSEAMAHYAGHKGVTALCPHAIERPSSLGQHSRHAVHEPVSGRVQSVLIQPKPLGGRDASCSNLCSEWLRSDRSGPFVF